MSPFTATASRIVCQWGVWNAKTLNGFLMFCSLYQDKMYWICANERNDHADFMLTRFRVADGFLWHVSSSWTNCRRQQEHLASRQVNQRHTWCDPLQSQLRQENIYQKRSLAMAYVPSPVLSHHLWIVKSIFEKIQREWGHKHRLSLA